MTHFPIDRPPKILVLFANLKGNLGDFAILEAILRDLYEHFPGAVPDVMSHGFLPEDEERTAAFLTSSPPHRFLGNGPDIQATSLVRKFPKWLARRWRQHAIIREAARKLGCGEFAEFARGYDLIVTAGGEHWSSPSLGIAMFPVLGCAVAAGVKCAAYPFSVRRKITDYNTAGNLRKYFHGLARPILVRDSKSHGILRGAGVDAELGADCVLGLACQARGMISAGGNNPPAVENRRIVFAVAEAPGSRAEETGRQIREIINAGFQVTLLTTCDAEDGGYLRKIAAETGAGFSAPMTWQEAVAEFSAHAAVITNRFHCIVFSFFGRVPVLPLGNREKARALGADARLPVAIDAISDLTPAVLGSLLARREEALAKAEEYLEHASRLLKSPLAENAAE